MSSPVSFEYYSRGLCLRKIELGFRLDTSMAATPLYLALKGASASSDIVQISHDSTGGIPDPLRLTVPEEFRSSMHAHVGILIRCRSWGEECRQ